MHFAKITDNQANYDEVTTQLLVVVDLFIIALVSVALCVVTDHIIFSCGQ